MLLVGDLIYNNDFDCNCNYKIYDCTDGNTWHDKEPIFSTVREGWYKPLDKILDMKIGYITTDKNVIIIEATQ